MKIVIYFVNDEKVIQEQRVINYDLKDQQKHVEALLPPPLHTVKE